MLITLTLVIFLSFIGIGLPDSILGVAWPIMYRELSLPISFAGYITITVSLGTVISSLLASRLVKRFGTGLVTAVSTLLTAVAILGFAFTEHPVFFFALAIPLGLGAGAIDTCLNAFIALHYSASVMSFLHCFYGIGVMASPFIMSLALGSEGNWRRGYIIVAAILFFITLCTFLALPLWFKLEKKYESEGEAPQRVLSIKEMLKTPGVLFSCLAFFGICSLELTVCGWASSYFVDIKGISADKAALITMLLYVGFSLGRFLSGVFAGKLGRRRILKISFLILVFSTLAFALPFETALSTLSLFFMGFGIGPTYPNLVHLTPKLFGEEVSRSIMGLQQTATYVGIMIMPWLFGVLAELVSPSLLPYFLVAMLFIYAAAYILLMKISQRKENKGLQN